jgi:hypothetical protein
MEDSMDVFSSVSIEISGFFTPVQLQLDVSNSSTEWPLHSQFAALVPAVSS